MNQRPENIGVEPNYSLESPRDDQLTARAASTGTVVKKNGNEKADPNGIGLS
jgi:hypothetical protein